MSNVFDIKVPDIGDFKDVPVIEVFVKVGDTVEAEDPLVSLESDKATMDVPAPHGGVVKAIGVKVGDKVSEGSVIMVLEGEGVAAAAAPAEVAKPSVSAPPSPVSAPAGLAEVRVPDIGDFKDVPVIEIFVKVGETVKAEDPLVSLESDKATMDVPAPHGGVVKAIGVKVGDKVSEGSVIMVLEGEGVAAAAAPAEVAKPSVSAPPSPVSAPAGLAEVRVPDIGDFKDVPVIEIFVKVGETVKAEDPLVSLESDKATMDVPAPLSGVVKEIRVKLGDKVSEGSVIMLLEGEGVAAAAAPAEAAKPSVSAPPSPVSAPAGLAEVRVPDIGDFKDVPVIEIFVKVGETVKAEDPLVSLESDKATMDVPAPLSGVVKEIRVKLGDKGSVIMLLEGEGVAAAAAPAEVAKPSVSAPPSPVSAPAGLAEVRVPDIGDFKDVPVIEVFVKVGDTVKAEDPLVSLESDKATMDVPAPLGGVVKEIRVKLGDKVSAGSIIMVVSTSAAPAAATTAPAAQTTTAVAASTLAAAGASAGIDEAAFALAYAGPAVRKLAREFGINLGSVKGTGDHGRIVRADVELFAKGGGAASASTARGAAAPATGGSGIDLLPWPKVDFAKFGPIDRKDLSRIKKISAANLHRNWVIIPHVTTHDEADITDLEQFRVQMNKELEKSGIKISMLPFMMKAAVATLKKFPEFNASLDGDALVLKNYWHIGFAADTPNGLMVPVIRDVDKKSIPEITKEMGELAKLARDGKLKPDQMQGGTFTISSLGGIGGIYFTPIINAPEVAIMGVCKGYWKQHSPDGVTSSWRLTLPLSLSWDHRVIDGAAAARFNVHFANVLADLRRVLF